MNVRLQEWLREEITSVLGEEESVEKWSYETAFPQLKRYLAVMVRSNWRLDVHHFQHFGEEC
jgi:hypothetical protein